MHRDKKIGLSLGVLLVGIVAAIFFRNEAQPTQQPPQLEDWQSLNEEIAEQGIGPYLVPPEPDTQAKSQPSASPPVPDYEESGLVSPFEEQQPIPLEDRRPAPAEKPAAPKTADAHPVSPKLNGAWEDLPAAPLKQPVIRFHVVERGETLSEIAEKQLGSQARFREIYELNRDVLSNPDAVRAGMRIRLPTRATGPPFSRYERKTPVNRLWQRVESIGSTRHTSPPPRTDAAPTGRTLTQSPPVDLPPLEDSKASRSRTSRTYRVQSGDSLEQIAVRFYGRRSAAQRIYDANRERLTSPDAIREGMTIVIP